MMSLLVFQLSRMGDEMISNQFVASDVSDQQ
jgi:hypothetical protein